MAATYNYISIQGVIIPDVAVTRAEVEQEYKDAFGQDLVVTANTPQGILITAETLARDSVARSNATLANQINPNIAGGQYLDAIWALTGGARNPASKTFVPGVVLTGVPGTSIPQGTTAQNVNNDIFESLSTVVLDVTGQAITDFQSVIDGVIDCPINTLTTLVDYPLGLETVNNPNAPTLGSDTQSDESTRFYRRNALALQGTALPEAITSALYNIPGFKSLKFRENTTSSTTIIDNVTMIPHSIYVCADGGSDSDVANVLLSKKSAGAGYNGSVTVNVTDPSSGQIYPVKFDRPILIPVICRVTINPNNPSVADPVEAIRQSILAYANGLINGEDGFIVGAQVSPFELAGAINSQYPQIFVKKLEVSYASPINYVVAQLFIEIFQKPTITSSAIQVVTS